MNEAPIASPFGPDDENAGRKRLHPPLVLKILVGIGLVRIGVTWVLALLKYSWSPPAWTFIFLNTLLLLLYVFLLRGSKISWWLLQVWSLAFVVHRIIDAFFYRAGRLPISPLFPDPISWMLLGAELALFLYLFTPQVLSFFFPSQTTP